MEVKKIIVDELQNGYMNKRSVVEVEIYASYIDENNTYITEYFHNFMDNPLEVEGVCVWKKDPEYNRRILGMDVQRFLSPHGNDFVYDREITKSQYIYCPNCGKRIRYEEE